MRTIGDIREPEKFTLDMSIYEDKDVVAFMQENNLTQEMCRHSYIELYEYVKHKDKYQLFWNGMVELNDITQIKIKNPGLEYLDKPIFKENMVLDDLYTEHGKDEGIANAWELRNQGFYLTGANGIGKTFFAVALANARYEQKKETTLFVFWPDFIQMAKRFEKESYRMVDRVKHAKYLIIDDLGQEHISGYVRDDILMPIITYRLERGLHTIITSNFEVNELYDLYTLKQIESKKVKSLVLKMTKLAKPVTLIGKDLRNG